MIRYNSSQEPTVFSKAIMDLFLEQSNPADVLALYAFYYYTAKWQQTNQVKSTTTYTAQGLKWSEPRVRKTKKILKQLKLIKDVQERNEKGQLGPRYIQIYFVWSRTDRNHYYGQRITTANAEGNALRTNKEYSINKNKENKENNTTFDSAPSNKIKPLPSLKKIKPNNFPRFWELYPKKLNKGAAKTVWNRLCKSDDAPIWSELRIALKKQSKTDKWVKGGFIPLPTTWLNQERWLDDPKTMTFTDYSSKNGKAPENMHFGKDYKITKKVRKV